MTTPADRDAEGTSTPEPKAGHGYRNEVNWRSGEGRQPYANQGSSEAEPPNLGDEVEGGNRGEHSGKALDELGQAKGKP